MGTVSSRAVAFTAIALGTLVSAQETLDQVEKPSTTPIVSRHADAVPREDCFPLERLSDPELKKLSEKLLQDALDSEAIYTLIGSAKPISEGFWNTRFRVEPPNTEELATVQAALSVWTCGRSLQADTLVFENLIEGQRHASAWVCNLAALRELIDAQPNYFGRLGITSKENPEVVLLSIERSQQRQERWRGFGLVFGYPEYSIDFFVRAGQHQAETGQFIERDFRSFPTFASKTGRFVYAVPKLSEESKSEQDLRAQAESILKHYTQLRSEYLGEDKPGIVALIRDWLDDGAGFCHPAHALQKVTDTAHYSSNRTDQAQHPGSAAPATK